MARRYINWKLVIILIVGLGVLGTAAVVLHGWQKNTRAERAKPLGEQAYDEGRWEEAAGMLGTYLGVYANTTDSIPVWMKYADAHLNIRPRKPNNMSQAFNAYVSVLRLDKGHDEAVNRLVELCLNPSVWRPNDAERYIVEYLKVKKDNPAIRRSLGVALIRQRKFSEASGVLVQLTKDHPDEVLAYEIMGLLAEDRPNDVNLPAINWFDEAVKQNPNSAMAYAVHASSLWRHRDPNAASADLAKAETLDLSDTTVHLRLVRELLNVRALDKAKAHLDTLRAKLPKDQTVWQYLAEWAMLSKSTDEMQKIAHAGLEEQASQPWDFLPVAAELYIAAGQLQDANDCIDRIRQKGSSPADLAFLVGLRAQKLGRLSETVGQWEQAITLGYRGSGQLRIELADVLRQMGDVQSAVEQLRTLVNDNPNFVDGRVALMRMQGQSRDWAGVQEQARRIQQLIPGLGEAVLMEMQARIQLLAAANSPAGADEAWSKIEDQLRQMDEQSKGATRVKLLRAQAAMLRTKFAEATGFLDELQKSGFSEVSVAQLRVQILIAQKQDQAAIDLLQKTIAQYPQDFDSVRTLVVLLNGSGKRQECESVVKDAIARAREPSSRRQLGLLLSDLYVSWGNGDQAQKLLSDLVAQFPDDIQVKRRLLILGPVAGNTAEAQKIVDQIKSLEGERSWQWRYEQAKVWFLSKEFEARYTDIVRLLKANLQARPDNRTSQLLLAAAYERHGEQQLAIAAYRDAVNLAPDDLQVIVRLVAALNKAGEATEARQILDRVADRTASNSAVQGLRFQNLVQLGEWDSASKVLEQLATSDPNDANTNLTLASILVRQKRYDEAQAILDRLKAKNGDSVAFTDAQVRLYIDQGKGDVAIKMCDDAVKSHDAAAAYRLRARTYSLLNQPAKAIQDIQTARQRDPNDLLTAQLAASLFINSGNRTLVRQAQDVLDRASVAHPDDVDLKYSRARLLILKGTARDSTQARQLLTDVTQARPRFVDAWEQLGWMELREGQPGRAVDVAMRALVYSPDDKRLKLLKAQGEARLSPIQAVPTLEALTKQDPNDVEVILQLVDAYMGAAKADKRMADRAVELLQRSIGNLKGVGRRRCEIALAAALYRNGQADNAAKQFAALAKVEPNDPSPVLTFARLLVIDKHLTQLQDLLNDWMSAHPQDVGTLTTVAEWLSQSQGGPESRDMAEGLLRSALQRNPKFGYALYSLAILLQNTGRNNEAVEMNQRAIEVDPNNVVAMNNLAWLLCEDQKKYDEALKWASKGLQIVPEYCDLIDTLGVINFRMGQYQEAIKSLKSCIELCPVGQPLVVQSRFHLARALAQLGRRTEATNEIQQALDAQDTLNQQNRPGGLSKEDQVEARRLRDQLVKSSS
jgi:tetratricopeptide (TPR) repeat protein